MRLHLGSAAWGLAVGVVSCMAGAWLTATLRQARNRRAQIRDIERDIEADLRRNGIPMSAKEWRRLRVLHEQEQALYRAGKLAGEPAYAPRDPTR